MLMLSNKKNLYLCKIIVVLLILVFCLISYIRSTEFSNLENNYNNNNYDNVSEEEINSKEIILEDRMNGNYCLQAIECFYEDNEYQYCFNCVKSNSMYVIINGVEYKLVYALENSIVTMEELENNGYSFLKKSKNLPVR